MNPVTTAIIAAVAAGAASGGTTLAEKALTNGYKALKGAVERAFGTDSNLAESVAKLEEKPNSEAQMKQVAEEVNDVKAGENEEVLLVAQDLLTQLQAQPEGARLVQQVAKGNYTA